MAVTKEVLSQYLSEKKEIEELQRRAKNYESKIARIEKAISKTPTENTIKDKNVDLENSKQILKQINELIHTQELNLILRTKQVEQFIYTINDSLTRRILSFRVLDGLTWKEISKRIGGKNTESSVKQIYHRFMGKD